MTVAPAKAPVAGTPISMTSYDEVLDLLAHPPADRAAVIAVCNVHSVMSARRSPQLAEALRTADVATPDGVPLVWGLRLTARPDQTRVYGPELMRLAMTDTLRPHRHYLYGSTPETLDALLHRIEDEEPDASIVGHFSPPFGPQQPDDVAADVERIRRSGADVIWVGLGMPKQELWMHSVAPSLPGATLIGVGAAFDFLAGTKRQAPSWMQRAGLEWLFRLTQEPRRLWRRYVINNPLFVLVLARQVIGDRLRRRRRV